MDFFLGNPAQQTVLQLMGHTLAVAQMTGDPEAVDLAHWLSQSDNLHLIQWFGRSGPEAEVSSYFTPEEWWRLGPMGIITEQQAVYRNAIHALEHFLPGRQHAADIAREQISAALAAGRLDAATGIEARY